MHKLADDQHGLPSVNVRCLGGVLARFGLFSRIISCTKVEVLHGVRALISIHSCAGEDKIKRYFRYIPLLMQRSSLIVRFSHHQGAFAVGDQEGNVLSHVESTSGIYLIGSIIVEHSQSAFMAWSSYKGMLIAEVVSFQM